MLPPMPDELLELLDAPPIPLLLLDAPPPDPPSWLPLEQAKSTNEALRTAQDPNKHRFIGHDGSAGRKKVAILCWEACLSLAWKIELHSLQVQKSSYPKRS